MSPRMGLRFKILLWVGLSVAVLDQWSKVLAVTHLTPAMALTHAATTSPLSPTEQSRIVGEIGFWDQVRYFYTNPSHPCRSPGAYCPVIPVVNGFWNWRYVENPGAAWGLLRNASDAFRVPFFRAVSVVALFFIIWFFRTQLKEDQLLLVVALSLVFGGAVGNFIDRLHLSYVVDFIDWYVGERHWPTFNVADSAITCGVVLMAIEWMKDARKSQAAEKVAETGAR
jgi:signal peptidase II